MSGHYLNERNAALLAERRRPIGIEIAKRHETYRTKCPQTLVELRPLVVSDSTQELIFRAAV